MLMRDCRMRRVLRLAANLSTLFTEVPFLERFAAAARTGFRYVEYQFPYDFDKDEVAARARAAGLQVVLHNAPPGGRAGDRGIACLPGREEEFRGTLERAVAYARAADCPRLHCLAGVALAGVEPAHLYATYVANLRHAAARLAGEGITLLIEPINTRSVPGYFLSGSGQAERVLDEVGAPNLRLQFDLFHMQIMEGDLAKTIERLLPKIGHMQLADVPDRHEPGTGEINFPWLLGHIDRIGYKDWIGCEYNPLGETVAGLTWAKPYL
jgi:hydroxypyruvate isomerase